MSQLYVFGLTAHTSIGQSSVNTPTLKVADRENIVILWASWCDVVFASPLQFGATLEYLGNSLNAEQVKHVRAIAYTADLKFFGRDLSDGVMGYISPSKYEITFFATPKDTKSGIEPIRTYSFRDEFWDILDIRFTPANRVLMSSKTRACVDLAGGYVVDMPSLEELEKCLLSRSFDPSDKHKEIKLPLNHCERLAFAPSQWCTNAATFTALDKEGKIYTWSFDRRYPKCLGQSFREHIGPHLSDRAAPIPYFSETKIKKIASGGYYSAAITDDGELYVWGEAGPRRAGGVKRELSVLNDKADEDEDDFVRSVELKIDGHPAQAIDVSVGRGHILVVAQDPENRIITVFAAGCNENGQLTRPFSVGFVEDFVELSEFRGWEIEQLVCAGYTSYVVVKGRPGLKLGRID